MRGKTGAGEGILGAGTGLLEGGKQPDDFRGDLTVGGRGFVTVGAAAVRVREQGRGGVLDSVTAVTRDASRIVEAIVRAAFEGLGGIRMAPGARFGDVFRIRRRKRIRDGPYVMDAVAVHTLGAGGLALGEFAAVDAPAVEGELVDDGPGQVAGHEPGVAMAARAEQRHVLARQASPEAGNGGLREVLIVDFGVSAVAIRATQRILVMDIAAKADTGAFLILVALEAKVIFGGAGGGGCGSGKVPPAKEPRGKRQD